MALRDNFVPSDGPDFRVRPVDPRGGFTHQPNPEETFIFDNGADYVGGRLVTRDKDHN